MATLVILTIQYTHCVDGEHCFFFYIFLYFNFLFLTCYNRTIAPTTADSEVISLTVNEYYLPTSSDTLIVYNGASSSAPILAYLSGIIPSFFFFIILNLFFIQATQLHPQKYTAPLV